MINLLLDEEEAKLIMMDLNTVRKLIYKEGSENWNMSKRIEIAIEHELEKGAIIKNRDLIKKEEQKQH